MRFRQQTRHGDGEGNCLLACVASMCDVEVEEVPDVTELMASGASTECGAPLWWHHLAEWLQENGYHAMMFSSEYPMPRDMPVIVIGPQASGDSHAVIYRDGEPVWDPNQVNPAGLTGIRGWLWISAAIPIALVRLGPPMSGAAPSATLH